jgi:hypothetical protein
VLGTGLGALAKEIDVADVDRVRRHPRLPTVDGGESRGAAAVRNLGGKDGRSRCRDGFTGTRATRSSR